MLKLLFLTPRLEHVLRKKQRATSTTTKKKKKKKKNAEKLRFDSGWTAWQRASQNLLEINLPNFVGWLQEPSKKEQKLILRYPF